MRDDDRGHATQMLIESIQQTLFSKFIERGSALVEDEHARMLQQRPRQRDALPFTTRQPIATRTERFVEPVRQALDQCIQLRKIRYALDFFITRVRISIQKILT